MNKMLENLMNGNLTDAKASAKRFSRHAIIKALVEIHGYSLNKATLTADWLKGCGNWQAACDAD